MHLKLKLILLKMLGKTGDIKVQTVISFCF